MSAPTTRSAAGVVPRRRALRATTAAVLRDTLVSAPLLVVVLLTAFGLLLTLGAGPDDDCCVATASGLFVGLYQVLASVSVTALLLPHVAAGGRRTDFSAALLVKHVLVTAFFVLVLTAVAAVDGSAEESGLLVFATSWAAGLAVLAATGTLVGAVLRRWGRRAWWLLPLTGSPLWGLWASDVPAATPLWFGGVAVAVVMAAIASHLVIRTTPPPDPLPPGDRGAAGDRGRSTP